MCGVWMEFYNTIKSISTVWIRIIEKKANEESKRRKANCRKYTRMLKLHFQLPEVSAYLKFSNIHEIKNYKIFRSKHL